MVNRPPVRLLAHWAGSARGGAWLLAVSVGGAALAVGTVHTLTLCIVTVGLAVAVALALWNSEPANARPAATLLLVTGLALTAYSALQCVPIPLSLLAKIAPRNADIWARALAPLREGGPSWAPISVDPTATRVEVLKGVAYLLTFVTALRVARKRGGISFLSGALVVTGTLLALLAVLHPAFGVHKLYGIWEPTELRNRHVAPFLNPNNLASYLNIAFCLAFAAAIAPEPRLPRPIPGSIALVLAATQVWVASRGGVATMVLGAALVLAVSRSAAMNRQRRAASASLVIGIALAAGILMFVLGGSEQASSELLDTDASSKLELLREAIRMVPAYPVFGTGRGAFESAFPAFRESIWHMTYTHPENVIAQWLIEWGTPIGLAGLSCVAFGLRPSAALARSSAAAGAWAAILAVAVQNLVDLGSEIPGLMLAVVVCAAIVTGGTAGQPARWRVERWGTAPRAIAITGVLAAAFAIASALVGIDTELEADQTMMYHAALDTSRSVSEEHDLARAAMLRHPAEPYFPFILAWRGAHMRDDNPIAWIEATLDRAKVYAPAHLVLARILVARSPSQARLEYRLAAEQEPQLFDTVAREAARVVGGYYDAIEVAPSGKRGLRMLELLGSEVQARLPATRARLDEEIAARDPSAPGPATRAASDAVGDLEVGEDAPWCQSAAWSGCVTKALALTEHAELLEPGKCEPHELEARARIASGNGAAGLKDLAIAADEVTDRIACLQALERLADRTHDERRAAAALAKIASSECSDDAECAANLMWAANEEESQGNAAQALALYKRAQARDPDGDVSLEAIARLAAAAGLHAEAADTYGRLARKHPEDPRWKNAADAQRGEALKVEVGL